MYAKHNSDVVKSLQADSRHFTVNEARNFQNNLVGKNYEKFNPMKMSSDVSKINNHNPAYFINKMGCSDENFKNLSKDQSENNYFEAIHKRTKSGHLSTNDAYNFRKFSVGGTIDGRGKSLIDLANIASNYKKFEDSRREQARNNGVTTSMQANSIQLKVNGEQNTFVNQSSDRFNQIGMSSEISRTMHLKNKLLDSYKMNCSYKILKDCHGDQVKSNLFAHFNRNNDAATYLQTGFKDSTFNEVYNCQNRLVGKELIQW